MTILPVQWLLLHSLRYMESYSWCGGGKTCAWSLIAVCILVQICQVGIESKLVTESKNGPQGLGFSVNERFREC